MLNSSSHKDSNLKSSFLYDVKPDICVYRGCPAPTVKTDSSSVEFFIEIKWNTCDDPFCVVDDENKSFLRDAKNAFNTLGQITAYAAVHLAAQFRMHVYLVFILRGTARILRWDRSGTIVTEPIHYNKSPHLVEFFRRYSKASDAMRGIDESVSTPTTAEARVARKALNIEAHIPLLKLSVPGPHGKTQYYITAPPEPTLYTPPGRATRGFTAYDIQWQRLVFLKDSWRIDLCDIMPEGQVYKILNTAKVKHVPTCLASGDISASEYHTTKTQNYVTVPWNSSSHHPETRLIPHQHYRLILDVIGQILVNFQSSREMVAAVWNGVIGKVLWIPQLDHTDVQRCSALQEAFEAGILHRDFSPGNVIIDAARIGWLIDWDLSRPCHPQYDIETPRRATRTVRPHLRHT